MDFNRNDSPNNNNNNNDGRKPGGNRPKGSIGTALLITLAIVLLVNWIYGSISKSQYTQTSFSDFLAAKDAGQLSEVEIQSDRIIYMTKEEAGKPAAMQKACYTGLPGGGDLIALSEELDAMGVKVDKKIVEDNSLIMMILSYALMIGGLFLSVSCQVWTLWPVLDLTGWLAVAFIIIIGTALSFTAFVTGISEIGPMKATLLGTLEPVIASVVSAIALGTTFHTVELIGYACIIATVFIIILQKKPAIS